jgi:hypothetical protein
MIQRLRDGSLDEVDPYKISPRAYALAELFVGEERTFPPSQPFLNVQSISTSTKVMARRVLSDPDANWSARTTNKGIRVKRIA